jgi:hypothetical protein
LFVIERNPEIDNPLTVEKLLNRPIGPGVQIDARRAEYRKYSTMATGRDKRNIKSLVEDVNRESVKQRERKRLVRDEA